MSESGEAPSHPADDHPASAPEGDEPQDDVAKDDDADSGASGQATNKSGASHGRKNSLTAVQSQTKVSDEQLNVEDVKRAITFSPSISEALADTVHPMREVTIPPVLKDHDQAILNKALQRLKDDFSETRAQGELIKMYDLYNSSLGDNSILEGHCHELQEKVRQYEARHMWEPRVLKVLLIAEKYRQEKASVEDEKNELEAEVVDMSIELKHMDDVVKNKNKDIAKVQDELKKAKEIEKQVEYLETVVMRKDNEIHNLQDSYDILLQTNFKLESNHPGGGYKMSIAPAHEDTKWAAIERELMARIDLITTEKLALKTEVEEKNRFLNNCNRKLSTLKVENGELENLRRENMKAISKMKSENTRLLNSSEKVEKKLAVMRDQLTLAKAEILTLKTSIEGCFQGSNALSHQLTAKTKENGVYMRQVSSMQDKVSRLDKEHRACESSKYVLRQESKAKDRELALGQKKYSDKKSECDAVSAKVYKLEQFKLRHMDLLKLTRMNTTQMLKEITGLRSSLVFEKTSVAKAENSMMRMQNQIEGLQREYLNVLDNNLLLVRNHEMASAAIEHFTVAKVATDRRIAHLMKTNIDLYTQTTSQQEIALIQTHQFQLKENEIKGLLSRLEEEDHKMERMLCKDKEKRNTIEQLHAEANSREEKIKTLKGIIESYSQLNKSLSDKAEELSSQLRATQTQRELIRRQRDLFGTKLLQAKAETELCQEGLRTAKETMLKYSVDFFNMQNDIRVLKLEVKNLRRKNKLADGHAELIHTLRQELGQACKALELQKCKNVILEETFTPKTHRWRGLLAADPSKYEMVLKNQLLIHRLIGKTKEIAKLEELLKQKDIMYLSLRVLVHRRMDAHLTPEMSNAKAAIRRQRRQLKSLTAELNMVNDDLSGAKVRENEATRRLKEKAREESRERAARLRAENERKPRLLPLRAPPSLPKLTTTKGGQ